MDRNLRGGVEDLCVWLSQ